MRDTLILVTPGFPKDEDDSTCIPERQIFVRVLKETYPQLNIVVVAFQYPLQPREYNWNGVKVIALGGKNKGGLNRRMTWIGAWQKLKKLNKENRVIGLISFWLDECAFIADKFSKKNQIKHYSWLLGQDARAGNPYVKRMAPKADELIALSDYLATEFKTNYDIAPKHIIPGAVDTAMFKQEPQQRDIDVLGVGSLIPLKQYHLFIETIAFLKDHQPNIKAIICGKGPELKKLKELAKARKLEQHVIFKGELTHTEILTYMQRSKALLHPSSYEGFSTVLSEALYAGAHVVSFFKPMKAEFAHHHIVKDQGEMNLKVLELLNNEELSHEPVLVNTMTHMARSVMELFPQQEVAMA